MLLVVEVDGNVAAYPSPPASTQALAEAEAVVVVNPVTKEAQVWKWRHGQPPPALYVATRVQTFRAVLHSLVREVDHQDRVHDAGPYGDDRDSVRVALAAMQDELYEALEAFHRERREPKSPERWAMTGAESLQVAALVVRLLRDLGWRDYAS